MTNTKTTRTTTTQGANQDLKTTTHTMTTTPGLRAPGGSTLEAR